MAKWRSRRWILTKSRLLALSFSFVALSSFSFALHFLLPFPLHGNGSQEFHCPGVGPGKIPGRHDVPRRSDGIRRSTCAQVAALSLEVWPSARPAWATRPLALTLALDPLFSSWSLGAFVGLSCSSFSPRLLLLLLLLFCAKPQMLHYHSSDHISTSSCSLFFFGQSTGKLLAPRKLRRMSQRLPSALRFTLSSSPLLLSRTLIRPLFFRDSSSIFLMLISSNKAFSKLKWSSSCFPCASCSLPSRTLGA